MSYFPNFQASPPSPLVDAAQIYACSSSSSSCFSDDCDIVKTEVQKILRYCNSPAFEFTEHTCKRLNAHILILLKKIANIDSEDFQSPTLWRDDSGKNLLHQICQLAGYMAKETLEALLKVCPKLAFEVDSFENFPFDYLPESYAYILADILNDVVYPDGFTQETGANCKWLALLCRIKNLSFAYAYGEKSPESLMPIEFESLDDIQITGKFLSHHIDELPLRILSKREGSETLISSLLDFWDLKMREATGIPSDLFVIYINDNNIPCRLPRFITDDSPKTPLLDSLSVDIEPLFQGLAENCPPKMIFVSKWLKLNHLARDHDNSLLLLRLTDQFCKDSDCFSILNDPMARICLKTICRHINDYVPYNLIKSLLGVIRNHSILIVEPFFKDYDDNLRKMTGIILDFFNESAPDNFFKIEFENPIFVGNLQKHSHLYLTDPLYKQLIDKYAEYDSFSLDLSHRDQQYVISTTAKVPLLTHNYCFEDLNSILLKIDATGYFVFQNTHSLEYCYDSIMSLVVEESSNRPQQIIKEPILTQPMNIRSDTVGYEFLCENTLITFIPPTPSTKYSTLLIHKNDTEKKFYGFFTQSGLRNFIKRAVKAANENRPSLWEQDEILQYIYNTCDQGNPETDRIFFNQCSLHNILPIWFEISQRSETISIHTLHPINTQEIIRYLPKSDYLSGLIMDLKDHLQRAIHNYKSCFSVFVRKIEEARNFFSEFPNVNYYQQRFPRAPAYVMIDNLIEINKSENTTEKKIAVIGDPYTNRYFAMWNTGMHEHFYILSGIEAQRRRELSIISGLIEITPGYFHSLKCNGFVKQRQNKLCHSEPASLTISDCLTSFDLMATKGKFNEYARKNKIPIETVKHRFQLIITKIISQKGIDEATPSIYRALKIMFTQTYRSYEINRPEGLPQFIQDLAFHADFCLFGLKKELWQHYYINFSDSLPRSESTYFERAVTGAMFHILNQFALGAINKKAINQPIHFINFLRDYIPKSIHIPADPNTIDFEDHTIDINANPGEIGDDYRLIDILMLSQQMLLPTIIIQLVRQWESVCNDSPSEYPDLFREYNNIERTPPLENAARFELEKDIEFVRGALRDKQQRLEEAKSIKLWKIYTSTLKLLEQTHHSLGRKRERSQDHSTVTKLARTNHIAAASTLISESSSSSSSVPRDIYLRNSVEEMNINPLIAEIKQLQNDIEACKTELQMKIDMLRSYNTLYGEQLYQMGELTESDPFTNEQKLTVKGSIFWLNSKRILEETTPQINS